MKPKIHEHTKNNIKNRSKTLFYALLLCLSAVACKDREPDTPAPDQLPPITQVGANTAGCMINGKVFLPVDGSQSFGGGPQKGLYKTKHYNGFYIDITNYKNNNYLFLYIPDATSGVGNYSINQSNGAGTPVSPNDKNQIYLEYEGKKYLSYDNSGVLNLTYYNNTIASATFSATLYNKDNPSETIQVTDGRFDVTF